MNDKKTIEEMTKKYKEEMMRIYSKAAAKNAAPPSEKEPPAAKEEPPEPVSEKEEALPENEPVHEADEANETVPPAAPHMEEIQVPKFPSPEEIMRAEGISPAAPEIREEPAEKTSAVMAEEHPQGNYGFSPDEENPEEESIEPLYDGSADNSGKNLTGTGYLKTEVTTGGASPVEGATVIISKKEGDKTLLIKMLVTGENGETDEIPLPAPALAYSETPYPDEKPFSEYTLSVLAEGYYMIPEITVPVFSTVKSIQPVSLIPLAEFDAQGRVSPSSGSKGW